MIFLINCSNLKQGGGVQVAQSLIAQLGRFKQHHFVVVLSNYINEINDINGNNVEIFRYNIKNTYSSIFHGRVRFLDCLVDEKCVDAVITIFGPSRWCPRVPHLCGFARAQLVLTDSPYYKILSIREKLIYKLWTWQFKKCSNTFFTENKLISNKIPRLLGKDVTVYTVSNCYNQVFDMPELWHQHPLPDFSGTTCLSVSSYYPHKNFNILPNVARVLKRKYPEFNFRFVLTFDNNELDIPDDIKQHFLFIGKVDIRECPDLYKQVDIMFMPSLMECFTATYPEAMRMEVPIVTTDLEFARGLCDNAACYYSAVDCESAADAIYKVAKNREYARQLVENGKEQLKVFGNYELRADKLLEILESLVLR